MYNPYFKIPNFQNLKLSISFYTNRRTIKNETRPYLKSHTGAYKSDALVAQW